MIERSLSNSERRSMLLTSKVQGARYSAISFKQVTLRRHKFIAETTLRHSAAPTWIFLRIKTRGIYRLGPGFAKSCNSEDGQTHPSHKRLRHSDKKLTDMTPCDTQKPNAWAEYVRPFLLRSSNQKSPALKWGVLKDREQGGPSWYMIR